MHYGNDIRRTNILLSSFSPIPSISFVLHSAFYAPIVPSSSPLTHMRFCAHVQQIPDGLLLMDDEALPPPQPPAVQDAESPRSPMAPAAPQLVRWLGVRFEALLPWLTMASISPLCTMLCATRVHLGAIVWMVRIERKRSFLAVISVTFVRA